MGRPELAKEPAPVQPIAGSSTAAKAVQEEICDGAAPGTALPGLPLTTRGPVATLGSRF